MRRITMQSFILLLCAAMALGAGSNICSVHKKQMTKKKVEVIILVCRHNHDEWQQYTNARARLFPNSGDEITAIKLVGTADIEILIAGDVS